MIALLLAAALQASPAEAPSPSAAGETPSRPAVAKAKDDPLVCRMEAGPDSRIRRRVCILRSQRLAREESHKTAFSIHQQTPVWSREKGN